jgi:hypothetical protein
VIDGAYCLCIEFQDVLNNKSLGLTNNYFGISQLVYCSVSTKGLLRRLETKHMHLSTSIV